MFKILLLSSIVIMFNACVSTSPSTALKPYEKAFEQEDAYILYALRAEQVGGYESASSIFNTLYEESDKKEYLYRSLKNDLSASKNQQIIDRVDDIEKGEINDFALNRLKIVSLIGLDKLEDAKELALSLVDKSDEVDDYLLVSEIYVKLKKYATAVKYLESAYVQDYNEKILNKMAIVLYVNLNRTKDAIAQLETHSRVHGCSKLICARLIGFYSNDNDIDGLLSAYLRMYEIDSDEEIAKKIVQIYGYTKNYMKMLGFLEKSKSDNELLLQIYVNLKNYDKAFPLAYSLYKKTAETTYLGQSAIFEYEAKKDKNDKEMQKSVIEKLEDVLSKNRDALYLNYLGYLLIDHEIDVKKGMIYIKEALEKEPDSSYYLDSLAWGYYKLGDCKKAYSLMKKVLKMDGSDNDEVILHMDKIKKCNKINKIGKK